MVNTMETTYVMIKPDGVQRGLISEIIGRFERKGLKLVGLKAMVPTEEIARSHYDVHKAVSYTHLTLPTTPYV